MKWSATGFMGSPSPLLAIVTNSWDEVGRRGGGPEIRQYRLARATGSRGVQGAGLGDVGAQQVQGAGPGGVPGRLVVAAEGVLPVAETVAGSLVDVEDDVLAHAA